MQPLARLPVFFALQGKRAVVAGGSAAAAWKAELLAAAGAQVDVFAPSPSARTAATSAEAACGRIVIHCRFWCKADLAGAALAVGAVDDDAEAASFAAAARCAGVPVNVSTSRRSAISRSAPSSIARRSSSASRPTARRRCSPRRSAPGSKRCCRKALRAGCRWRSAGAARSSRSRPLRRTAVLAAVHRARRCTHPDRAPQESDFDGTLASGRAGRAGDRTRVGDPGRRRTRRP